MRTISWERLAAVAAVAYVVFYAAAFALGIEVGETETAVREYYADSSNRAKEVAAFFLIAAAALALLLFTSSIRHLIDRVDGRASMLGGVAGAGGVASATLVLAANAVSRAPAFAAMSNTFTLDVDTRELTETAGFLLFVSGALAAILLVAAVSVAALRYGLLPRWLGWLGIVVAVLLPLAIGFIGFLVFFVWLLAIGGFYAFRRSAPAAA